MCGIAGYFARGSATRPAPDVLAAMAKRLSHRGPDGQGGWIDAEAGVGLGHRRLAIIDLSSAGDQPMWSASRRYVIVFNGEIYNYRRLADELRKFGREFRSQSDTEVILAAIEQWGLRDAAARFIGIFAFALWDTRSRTLHLVRDHLGVKPLYYGHVGAAIVFGSELKALTVYPGFDSTVDRNALALLTRHNCIPAPHSIYRSAKKVLPATILTFSSEAPPTSEEFWSARATAEDGARNTHGLSDAAAVEALDHLLRDAVDLQMISDVPFGAFLSGGIDSSTIVAVMQAQRTARVRTFSIGFDIPRYNEAPHARLVAEHLGTDHTEMYVTSADALATIPDLPRCFDEPFSDSSQIPTLLVSRLARKHVTVSLSGDGGDELFAGYQRHVLGARLWSRLRYIPRPLRSAAAAVITAIPPDFLERAIHATGLLRSKSVAAHGIGANLHKFAEILPVRTAADIYRQLTSHWKDPAALVLGSSEPGTIGSDPQSWPALPTLTEQMLYLDMVTYLPDDILTKVDRASMSISLEARVPFLDPRVVEFAWRLPLHQRTRNGVGKWILREVLRRYVPPHLTDRPKAGFGIPIDAWLRGPLRDWAAALLDPSRLRQDGYFNSAMIRRLWDDHQSGRSDHQYHLWDILMFQAWYHDGGRA